VRFDRTFLKSISRHRKPTWFIIIMTGNFMLDLSDGIINAWLKRGCVQLHVLKTDIYDKKKYGFLVSKVSNILHLWHEDHVIFQRWHKCKVIRLFRVMSIPNTFSLFRVLTSEIWGKRLPVFRYYGDNVNISDSRRCGRS